MSPQSSVPHYLDVARRFATHVPTGTPGELDGLTAAAVTGFVLSVSQRRSVREAKVVSTRLRSFLRHLEIEGLTRPGLLAAMPSVAGWELTGLTRAISAADVGRLLGSCDRGRPARRRDFAILTVLARLAGEVAALCLGDIDWRAGELAVQAKGRPARPAAADAGGRRGDRRLAARWPTALHERRGLHPRPCPPRGLSARAVSGVVREACVRAGLPPMAQFTVSGIGP